MAINDLNKRITFQTFTITKTNGFQTENWIDYKTVWASVNNLYGKEYWSAKAVNAENTVEFVIRYSSDTKILNTKDYRILWNGRYFNINSIDNIKYENKWLKIKAIEVI